MAPGYPRGLDARSLTLPQRIVAVADIVSALSEERSYKAAFPLEEVLNILEGMCERGKLCPQVIGVLRDHRERIYAEARRAGDETHAIYDRIHREFATSIRGILSPASA